MAMSVTSPSVTRARRQMAPNPCSNASRSRSGGACFSARSIQASTCARWWLSSGTEVVLEALAGRAYSLHRTRSARRGLEKLPAGGKARASRLLDARREEGAALGKEAGEYGRGGAVSSAARLAAVADLHLGMVLDAVVAQRDRSLRLFDPIADDAPDVAASAAQVADVDVVDGVAVAVVDIERFPRGWHQRLDAQAVHLEAQAEQ